MEKAAYSRHVCNKETNENEPLKSYRNVGTDIKSSSDNML